MQLTHSHRGNETKLVRNLFVKLTEFDPEFDDVFSRYFVVMRWSEVTDDARTYTLHPHSTYSERYSSTWQESGGPLCSGKECGCIGRWESVSKTDFSCQLTDFLERIIRQALYVQVAAFARTSSMHASALAQYLVAPRRHLTRQRVVINLNNERASKVG